MPLRSGRVSSFAGGMAEAIEQAFVEELFAVKGVGLPPGDPADRRILFVAIARGVLRYLEANQNDLINTLTYQDGPGTSTLTVTQLDLDIST